MLYEKLNPQMRQMVDEYVARLRPLAWRRRSDLLAQAALPFNDELPPDKARLAAKGLVTAVLERWDNPEVTDPHQACLYLSSLAAEHRAMAERYLQENPEMKAAVEQELGGPSEE